MMKLHKSLFLLFLIALVGCASRNESSIDSTSSREYPTVDPVFSLHVYEADDAEAESFIVGNSYLAVVGVDNYKEGAYVFNDDFSFSYNENVFDIDPYDHDYGYGFVSYRFIISVKADSNNNAITVNHLNKEIGTIKKDIVECTAKFSYYRYDFCMNGVNMQGGRSINSIKSDRSERFGTAVIKENETERSGLLSPAVEVFFLKVKQNPCVPGITECLCGQIVRKRS